MAVAAARRRRGAGPLVDGVAIVGDMADSLSVRSGGDWWAIGGTGFDLVAGDAQVDVFQGRGGHVHRRELDAVGAELVDEPQSSGRGVERAHDPTAVIGVQAGQPVVGRCAGTQPHLPGVGAQLVGRSGGRDPTVVHDRDPVGELLGLLEVLGGQEHCDTVVTHRLDAFPQRAARLRVQTGGRFVEEQHGWPGQHRAGDVESAAHAAGVRADHAVGGPGEAELLEQR